MIIVNVVPSVQSLDKVSLSNLVATVNTIGILGIREEVFRTGKRFINVASLRCSEKVVLQGNGLRWPP